jgi:hypothetical protein
VQFTRVEARQDFVEQRPQPWRRAHDPC